uniref:Movement protein TGBp3 n=1 Tax=Cymodocea nodosa foveavirus 1 TaxID=2794432 RepID=A0A7T5QZE8_9VIRU|nr:TGB3 [Cymodocea nodosa foveavirus 1]
MPSTDQIKIILYALAAIIAIISLNNLISKEGCNIIITGERVQIINCEHSESLWKNIEKIKPFEHLSKKCKF